MKPPNTCSIATMPSVYLRSLAFFLGQVILTLLLAPLILLLRPFRFEVRYAMANLWVRSNLWLLGTVCGLRFEVRGQEHIPAQTGVIFCKHQSAFETIALQVIFPQVVFVLKRELLRIPVWGWAMAALEPIAIDRQARSQAMKQILRDGETRIKAGRWVALFPEGTRVAPGQTGRYGSSGGILAQRSACPVVPVAHNAGEYWPKNGFLKFPGLIQVRIGSALDGSRLASTEINRQAEAWIEAQMAEITGFGPYAPKAAENSLVHSR